MTATMTSPRVDLLAIRLRELQAERDLVKSELIGESGGDVADRATNVDANIRFALLEQRIESVELELAGRPVARQHDGTVSVGDIVTIELGEGPERFLIGSVDEASNGFDVLTPVSPLGRVIVGAQVGDTVSYSPRRGRTMLATVIAVE